MERPSCCPDCDGDLRHVGGKKTSPTSELKKKWWSQTPRCAANKASSLLFFSSLFYRIKKEEHTHQIGFPTEEGTKKKRRYSRATRVRINMVCWQKSGVWWREAVCRWPLLVGGICIRNFKLASKEYTLTLCIGGVLGNLTLFYADER